MKFFFIFIFVCMSYASESLTLRIAPLPTNNKTQTIEAIVPLFSYIEKISKIKTQYIYEKEYDEIIKKFKNNEIDIAILGPLPYLKLRETTQKSEPIIEFKNDQDKGFYRCVLAKFGNDTIDFNKQIKVALTQPLSTCGYYMTQQLLKNQYNIALQNQRYDYKMSHSAALTSVLEGDFHLAGVKESIAEDFSSLGVEIVAKSDLVPEFALVVNTQTLSTKQIKIIRDLILSIPPSTYKQWKGFLCNGFLKADKKVYDKLQVDFKMIPKKGNIQ